MPLLLITWLAYQQTPGSQSATTYFPLVYSAYAAQFIKSVHRMMVCDA